MVIRVKNGEIIWFNYRHHYPKMKKGLATQTLTP